MLLDLAFGLHHEAQADLIADSPGHPADAERAGVPEGIQEAGAGVELSQAVLRPREVVCFFARRFMETFAQRWVASGEELCVVQSLRTNFADMIDSHQ